MFTGLIETPAQVRENQAPRFVVQRPAHFETSRGDSVAVNGCCLTVCDESNADVLVFDVSPESLEKTSLGEVLVGGYVHLERALRLGDRLGGHWVSGHVDDCARVVRLCKVGQFSEFVIEVPERLCRYFIEKGSVCVDGVSLTVNSIEGAHISMMLIPETLEKTHFANAAPGQKVNVEVDILGKYVERLMSPAVSDHS